MVVTRAVLKRLRSQANEEESEIDESSAAPLTTGGRRKRALEESDTDAEEDDSDFDGESVQEADAKPKAKKRRCSPAKKRHGNHSKTKKEQPAAPRRPLPIEVLPSDVLQNVFLFLDNAKDILNVTLRSNNKHLLSVLTDEIVVRSAVFGGGKPSNVMSQVMALVKRGAILTPSTKRLLRLCFGNQCERGEECYAFNATIGRPMAPQQERNLGMCICDICANIITAPVTTNKYGQHFARNNSKVATLDCNRMLLEHHTAVGSGEMAGPLVLAKPVMRIEYSSFEKLEDQEEALNELVKKKEEELGVAKQADRTASLITLHETATSEFPKFEESKKQLALEKRTAENQRKASKKMTSLRRIFDKIAQGLEECAHKHIALACVWKEASSFSFHVGCSFEYGPSRDWFGPLMSAPSKATLKKINTAVEEVWETYDTLHSNGFLEENWLSFLEQSTDRFDVALLQHCREEPNITWQTMLKHHKWSGTNRGLSAEVESLKGGADPRIFLCSVLGEQGLRLVFERCLNLSGREATVAKYKQLAARVWNKSEQNVTRGLLHEKYRRRFIASRKQFRAFHTAFRDYLQEPDTRAWLRLTEPPPERSWQTFSRRNAVHTTLTRGNGLDLLQARDFAGLLTLHKDIFNDYTSFSH